MKRIILTLSLLLCIVHLPVHSQNTGPIAPEASSFEPVDATDMVNLVTGDMSYVLPLMEVPGPEGGYPIVLSYHGGVTPDLESSWIGLGWNINPGAINRNINSLPDDWNGTKYFEYSYDPGGSSNTDYFGFYLPLSEFFQAVPSIGLTIYSGDNHGFGGIISYKGFSFNFSSFGEAGFGLGIPGNNFNFSVGVGMNASQGLSLNGGMSFNLINSSNKVFNALYSNPSIGMSLASDNITSNINLPVSFNHFSTATTANDWCIINSTKGTNLLLVNWGNMNSRYFLNKEDEKNGYGLLYIKNAYGGSSPNTDMVKKDNVLDFHQVDRDVDGYIDPSKKDQNYLLLASSDQYDVSAQGLQGSFKASLNDLVYVYNEAIDVDANVNLYRKYFLDDNPDNPGVKSTRFKKSFEDDKYSTNFTLRPNFYFENEDASDLIVNSCDFQYNNGLEIEYGDEKVLYDPEYFLTSTKRKITGKCIEWFTNEEICSEDPQSADDILSRGFLESSSLKGKRNDGSLFPASGIGAFSITDIDGTTYHYSLPIYQFEEFLRIYNDNGNGAFVERRKLDAYACSWLLTAITGPDYIDRGQNGDPNGIVDGYDWGYWVCFDYGKLTDGYLWSRRAKSGKTLNVGRKQIYYLNTIRTKTHTAYFIKDFREDGKGDLLNPYSALNGLKLLYAKEWKCGLFNLKVDKYSFELNDDFSVTNYDNRVLKLSKIILVKNDAPFLGYGNESPKLIGNTKTSLRYKFSWESIDQEGQGDYRIHSIDYYGCYLNNILESKDLPVGYLANAIKVIEFSQDYSLNQKLTLKSVNLKGLGGSAVLPPYLFSYQTNKQYVNTDSWGFNAEKTDDNPKPSVDLWNLNSITTPTGAILKVNYESDTYEEEDVFKGNLLHKKNLTLINIPKEDCSNSYVDVGVPDIQEQCKDFLIKGKARVDYTMHRIKKDSDGNIIYKKDNDGNLILDSDGNPIPDIENKGFYEYVKINTYNALPVRTSGNVKYLRLFYNDCNGDITTKLNNTDWEGLDNWNITSISLDELTYVFTGPLQKYGGGLRVGSITTTDPLSNITNETEYFYKNGITSYAPHEFDFFLPYISELPAPCVLYGEVEVKNKINSKYTPSSTLYHFNNQCNIDVCIGQYKKESENKGIENNAADWYTVCLKNETSQQHNSTNYTVKIVDKLNNRGSLIDLQVKNELNQIVSQTKNIYRSNFKNQESYLTTKVIGDQKFNFNSVKITHAMVLDKLEQKNITGQTIASYSYDQLTGKVLSTEIEKPNGEIIINRATPAYVYYPNMGSKVENKTNKNMLEQIAESWTLMKKGDGSTQVMEASVLTWKSAWLYREFNGGSYIDRTKNDVWRKHKAFVWKGEIKQDGSYKYFVNKEFNWALANLDDNNSNGWLKTNEITRYNHYSMPLEFKDINGNYGATKINSNNSYIVATASNCDHLNMGATSFENVEYGNDFGSEFIGFSAVNSLDFTKAHMGKASLKIEANSKGPQYKLYYDVVKGKQLIPGRTYRASVWVLSTSDPKASLSLVLDGNDQNGTNIHEASVKYRDNYLFKAGQWYLLSTELKVPLDYKSLGISEDDGLQIFISNVNASIPSYFDDLRFAPVDAGLSTFVYDDAGNVTAILDNNNFASKFEYDDAGRLIRSYKETPDGFKKVSENKYNYKRSKYYSDFSYSPLLVIEGNPVTFTATDCGQGAKYSWKFGNDDPFTIPALSITRGFNYPGGIVTLTVTDGEGKVQTISKDINVKFMAIRNPIVSETYNKGSNVTAVWDSNLPGKFELYVYIPVQNTGYVKIAEVLSSGNYGWTVPLNYPTGSGYKFKVVNLETGYSKESVTFTVQ